MTAKHLTYFLINPKRLEMSSMRSMGRTALTRVSSSTSIVGAKYLSELYSFSRVISFM